MLASLRIVFGCLLAVAAAGLLAVVTAEPMLFPSLGPTIIMLVDSPGRRATAPRSIVLAHGAGLITGWLSLAIFGLLGAPSALATGVDWPRAGAAALSVAGTAALNRALRAPHPPAAATTLIVSLGFFANAD